jgi:chromosome segregation ATPase
MQTLADLKRRQAKLNRQLVKKEKEVRRLEKLIGRARKKLTKLEARLSALIGAPALEAEKPARRKRQRRTGPGQKELVQVILQEAGKPLSLGEIVERMTAKGYKFHSRKPKQALGVLIYTNQAVFRKAKRGYFTLRGRKSAK